MLICDFTGSHEAKTLEELGAIFSRRFADDSNSFWLADSPTEYPQLAVLVRGDLAMLNYLPHPGSAGFQSVGSMVNIESNGTTRFQLGPQGESVIVVNSAIVPVAKARQVVEEFFVSRRIPKSIAWLEL